MQLGNDGRVPVFVFPTSITFYLEDRTTHKQMLTLYNPYDFPLRFRVLCTNPKKYSVVDPDGVVKAKCCADIVVRHSASQLSLANCHAMDKFRIQMYDVTTRQMVGKRDVVASLVPGEPPPAPPDKEFESLPGASHSTKQAHTAWMPPPTSPQPAVATVSAGAHFGLLCAVAAVCLAVLFLPTDCSHHGPSPASAAFLPEWAAVSVGIKLAASFVIGLVTMGILRPG